MALVTYPAAAPSIHDRVVAILQERAPISLDDLLDAGYEDLGNEIAMNEILDVLHDDPMLYLYLA